MKRLHSFRASNVTCIACKATFPIVSGRAVIPLDEIGCDMTAKRVITLSSEEFGGMLGQLEEWAFLLRRAGHEFNAKHVEARIEWLRDRTELTIVEDES